MKKCIQCLNEGEFGVCSKNIDGLQNRCKTCKREYDNKWYKNNKDQYRLRKNKLATIRRNKLQEKINNISLSIGCADCGFNKHPAALQFDHIRGYKVESISQLISRGNSLSTIMEEINKCEVRCANCHAIKTANEFGRYKGMNK